MKPLFPHDPHHEAFDDLIAAALHGDLTPEERAQFDSRLSHDPAARAAYQEAQAMHDLLERNYQNAQPDPAFEPRMVSGVRRKIQDEAHRETAWESMLALWAGMKRFFAIKRKPLAPLWQFAVALLIVVPILAGVALGPITSGIKRASQVKGTFTTISGPLAQADIMSNTPASSTYRTNPALLAALERKESRLQGQLRHDPSNLNAARSLAHNEAQKQRYAYMGPTDSTTPQGGAVRGSGFVAAVAASPAPDMTSTPPGSTQAPDMPDAEASQAPPFAADTANSYTRANADIDILNKRLAINDSENKFTVDGVKSTPASSLLPAQVAPTPDSRKLIRNAQLDLEVKNFQATVDQITAMTRAAGGYVDTSNSQRGGNGKLQGTVVVKVLPQNLDGFLLKLRDLGEVQNQSVSTDDVTKDYFDTQARLDNSRRMETQLQDLLKHENGKVSDLLAVERELGRVRGQIEQVQGQLKLYDFQVQYATVTIQMREKDLNQAAAYLLKETDDFSVFAVDVEATFQKARQSADDLKAHILVANLNHNSGSDVSAMLVVSVPPDQIEQFLAEIKALGRVDNFTRQTSRVARDGGNTDQPADQTLTEKDNAIVNVSIRSDDDSRKQVALTVVTKAVDAALDQARTAAQAQSGVEILSSSLNKAADGQSTAQLSVRVPGADYAALLAAFQALGRTASISIQRNDNSGPGANGDDAPVIVSLSLTDQDTPMQETEISVMAADVEGGARQIKKDAVASGVEVKASSFERQPDGTEMAQMTFRLPMSEYPAFVDRLESLGKIESLSVHRDDRPEQALTDDNAPAEISLQLHNQREIVPDNGGFLATLRQTFAEGAAALFGSVRVIGVAIAFLTPWVLTLVLLAWIGRRIYVARKK